MKGKGISLKQISHKRRRQDKKNFIHWQHKKAKFVNLIYLCLSHVPNLVYLIQSTQNDYLLLLSIKLRTCIAIYAKPFLNVKLVIHIYQQGSNVPSKKRNKKKRKNNKEAMFQPYNKAPDSNSKAIFRIQLRVLRDWH